MRIMERVRMSQTFVEPEQRDHELRVAMHEAASACWLSKDGAALASTASGIAKYLSLGLQHKHPEMTYAKVFSLIGVPNATSRKHRDAMLDAWNLANYQKPKTDGADHPSQESPLPSYNSTLLWGKPTLGLAQRY
jgi:hypothetical protein